MFFRAYSPEQAATGKLENGRDVIILYVKEFKKQCQEVNDACLSKYRYNWFYNKEQNAYVLQVSWGDEVHVAIRFEQQHYRLLAAMVEPKDVILTTIPITDLVSKVKENGNNVLDFSGPVVTFSQIVFDDPKEHLPSDDLVGPQYNYSN
jgi:hypothetical protein